MSVTKTEGSNPAVLETQHAASLLVNFLTAFFFDQCIVSVTLYTVLKSFRHKGVEQFFRTGSKAKIQPKHAQRLRKQLFALDNAKSAQDMNAPGWRLHPLHGKPE